jgi:hypothetical protein
MTANELHTLTLNTVELEIAWRAVSDAAYAAQKEADLIADEHGVEDDCPFQEYADYLYGTADHLYAYMPEESCTT